jgi:hypothetical protein
MGLDKSSYQYLLSSKIIIPLLTISIQGSLAKDLDVLTTPNPECDRLLEIIIEVVRLPICDIISELHVILVSTYTHKLNLSQRYASYLDFTF